MPACVRWWLSVSSGDACGVQQHAITAAVWACACCVCVRVCVRVCLSFSGDQDRPIAVVSLVIN